MKLAKKAGCARGSGLLYKDICWLLSLGRPRREEPGSETCKEIETTRRLLKEHSTQTLTASHSEHEAIKTWSGKLPSLYFTQQENLGCPGWQNTIRPPKSSEGLSHFVQAYYSAGTRNIQHRLDWNFHCYCEVLADKRKKPCISMLQFWTCSLHTSDVLPSPPQDGGKLVSVSADSDMPVDRSAYMHPCVTPALCVAGGDRDLLQVAHVLQRGSPGRRAVVPYCRCLPR